VESRDLWSRRDVGRTGSPGKLFDKLGV